MYDAKESEGTRRRHQVDTVVEGIGINRITKNVELALPVIDDAFRWSASIFFVQMARR
jgi:cysteine synthase A